MYTFIWSTRAWFYVQLVRVATFFRRKNLAVWAAGRYTRCVSRLHTHWYAQRVALEKRQSKQYPPDQTVQYVVEPVSGEPVNFTRATYESPPEPKLGVVIGPNEYRASEYSHADGMSFMPTAPLTDMRKFDPNDEVPK